MKINSQTKISALIKENPETIEAIASINPHFNKLRNPVLRKILASRVTVADAARIGKCEPAEIFAKLAAIGFEVEREETGDRIEAVSSQHSLIQEAIEAGRVETLDVRPILAGGVDPFKEIMGVLKTLPPGFALEVINTFEPAPLILILKNKGYLSEVRNEAGVIYTYFLKVGEEPVQAPAADHFFRVSIEELEQHKESYRGRCREIDVRDLEMPLPLVTILNELEGLPENHALFVHHKKTPQYLLPELEERGFKTWIADIEEGNVKLLIHR